MRSQAPALDRVDLTRLRETWAAVMRGFVPGLGTFEQTLYRCAEAALGHTPQRILDLGGGPGVLAEGMARRWPQAAVTVLDLDPVLLELARAALPANVHVRHGDLASASWAADTGRGHDLIVIVMTLHYLPAAQARAVYRNALDALAPGGLLVVADLMPDDGITSLMNALDPADEEAAAELAWAQWWSELAEIDALQPHFARRAAILRDRAPADFIAPASWHLSAAQQATFAEAGVIWRCGRHAALGAIRRAT
jgi:trans-aconitate methyltransferase